MTLLPVIPKAPRSGPPRTPNPQPGLVHFSTPPSHNDHIMMTRGKVGIFKPKVLLAFKHVNLTDDLFEPSCYTQAKSDPNWCQAMDVEYHALIKKALGLSF